MATIKQGRTIDYTKIIHNVDDIIEALEYDSMRSAGKVKINAGALNELYEFRNNVVKKQKPATVKREG